MKRKVSILLALMCVTGGLSYSQKAYSLSLGKMFACFSHIDKIESFSSSMFIIGYDIYFHIFSSQLASFSKHGAPRRTRAAQADTAADRVVQPRGKEFASQRLFEIPLPERTTCVFLRKVKGKMVLYCTINGNKHGAFLVESGKLRFSCAPDFYMMDSADSGKCTALYENDAKSFWEMDGLSGAKLRRIPLPQGVFPRRVIPWKSNRYLLLAHVFNRSASVLSLLDDKGRILSTCPVPGAVAASPDESMREVFWRELRVAAVGKENIYIAAAYPQQSRYTVNVLTKDGALKRTMNGTIQDYPGFPPLLLKYDIADLQKRKVLNIASIDALCEGDAQVFVSIGRACIQKGGIETVNDEVHVFSTDGRFLGGMENPYGPIAHYDRDSKTLYSIQADRGGSFITKKLIAWRISANT